MNISLSTVPLYDSTCSIVEAGTYAFLRIYDDLPKPIQKIVRIALENFQSLRNSFQFTYLGTPVLAGLSLSVAQPFSTAAASKYDFFLFNFLSSTACSLGMMTDYKQIFRVSNIALHILMLRSMNSCSMLTQIYLICGIAASCYSFYLNFKGPLKTEATIKNPSIDETNEEIFYLIESIIEEIPDLNSESLAISASNLEVLKASDHSFSSISFISEPSLENKEAAELNSLNQDIFIPDTAEGRKNVIRQELFQLIKSIKESLSKDVIFRRIERIESFLSLVISNKTDFNFAKEMLTEIIYLQLEIEVEEIDFCVQTYFFPKQKTDDECTICLESNPEIGICLNGHAFHNGCLHDYIKNSLSSFLPATTNENFFQVIQTDHYKEKHGGIEKYTHSTQSGRLIIPPTILPLCPTCKSTLFLCDYNIRHIKHSHYGKIPAVLVVKKEP